MISSQQMDTSRCVYQMKTWKRAFCIILGFVLIACGSIFTLTSSSAASGSLALIPMMFFLAAGIYMFAWALRARLVIDGPRIEVRSAFQQKTADRSEIEGFRTFSSRNGTYLRLYLKDDRGSITVPRDFETDGEYDSWFRQIPDLDQRDREALLDEISHQEALGATPEERMGALATAKTWSIFLLVVAIAAAVVLNFAGIEFRMISAAVLAAAPVVMLGLLWRTPLLYAVFKQKADPRAEVSFVLMAAGLGLLIRDRDVHLVSMQPLLWLVALIALAFLAGLWGSLGQGASILGKAFGLLFFAGMYSYGLVVLADTLPDRSPVTPYATTVVGKHVSHGRSTTYTLRLAPWGPLQEPNGISVSSRIYEKTDIGDTVCLDLRPGALHVPWYVHVPCDGQVSPDLVK